MNKLNILENVIINHVKKYIGILDIRPGNLEYLGTHNANISKILLSKNRNLIKDQLNSELRDILKIKIPNYKDNLVVYISTGINSGFPGFIFPFSGLVSLWENCVWFVKITNIHIENWVQTKIVDSLTYEEKIELFDTIFRYEFEGYRDYPGDSFFELALSIWGFDKTNPVSFIDKFRTRFLELLPENYNYLIYTFLLEIIYKSKGKSYLDIITKLNFRKRGEVQLINELETRTGRFIPYLLYTGMFLNSNTNNENKLYGIDNYLTHFLKKNGIIKMTKYSTIRKKIRYINNFELNAAIGNSTFHHKDLAINSLRNIYMLLAYIASSVLEEKIFTKEIKDFKCFEYNFFMMSNKIFYIYDILPLKTLEYSIDMELFEDKEGDRKVKEYLQRPKVQNFLIDFVRINPTILDYFKKYAVDQMYEILERLKGPAIIQNKYLN